jgi:hypothetical protein
MRLGPRSSDVAEAARLLGLYGLRVVKPNGPAALPWSVVVASIDAAVPTDANKWRKMIRREDFLAAAYKLAWAIVAVRHLGVARLPSKVKRRSTRMHRVH